MPSDSNEVAMAPLAQNPEQNVGGVSSLLELSNLRLSQNFSEGVSVTKLLNTVPVQKPRKTDFFRINPNIDHTLTCGMIEFKEDSQIYLVSRELRKRSIKRV
jgi:hypothetical protein